MEQIDLRAETRNVFGKKTKRLRRAGTIPATLYGPRTDSVSLQVPERDLRQVLDNAGTTHLITLWIDQADEPKMTLAREIQRHPVTHSLLHVDLYEVVMSERITAEVPLSFVGEAPIAAQKGGLLMRGLDSVQVRCLPGDLVGSIDVDLTVLTDKDQAILVKDLVVDRAIEISNTPEEVVVKVLPIRAPVLEEELVEEVEVPEVEVLAAARKAEMEAAEKPHRPAKPKEGEETEPEE